MNHSLLHAAIPLPIVRKLRLVRLRKIWIHIASALVTALAVLLASMGVAMLIDWLATLYDSRWRVVLTASALSAAVATAVGWLIVARRRLVGLDRIAGDVDRHVPQLQERWATITNLGAAASQQFAHPAMLRRVATEAVRWEPHVEPDEVVPLSTLVRSMIGLTAVTAVFALAVMLNSHRTLTLMWRFWRPASSISATELVDVPGSVVIGRGEPLELATAVRGEPVERATLFLRSGSDAPQTIGLVAHGRDPIEFSHRLRSVEKPFEYRFRAGDGQTAWFSVAVADRPKIEKLTLTVTPPAYTHREVKSFDKLPRRVYAIQNSKLELAIRPKAPVESAQLQMGNDRTVRLEPDGDGWYRWSTTLAEGFAFAPVLTESHGLTNRRSPTCRVDVYPDRPPAVKVVTPDDQIAVRPDDVVQITFSAKDDVGIGSAELLVYDGSAVGGKMLPIAAIPIPLGDEQGARVVQQTVDLDLSTFVVDDGAEMSYEIRVLEQRENPPASAADPSATETAANSSSPTQSGTDPQTVSARSARETPERRAPRETRSQPAKPQVPPRLEHPVLRTAMTERTKSLPSSSTLSSDTRRTKDAARPGPNSASQERTAKRQAGTPPKTADAATSTPDKSSDPATARTAISRRQGFSTDHTAADDQGSDRPQEPNSSQQERADVANAASSQTDSKSPPPGSPQSKPDATEQANNQQAPTGNRSATSGSNSPANDEPPGDSMPRRRLDVGQSSCSQRMRLKIDSLAGSFTGQQRAKLEMAIGPELEALDSALAKGQRTARGVLDQLEAGSQWRSAHDRDVSSAERSTLDARHVIDSLQQRSKNTPYAFIGLQVADIGLAHVDPARSNFWKSLQSDGDDRTGSVRDGWQHLGRARELVAELRGQFERARREFQLADSVEHFKKMYQVYIENSQALLEIQDTDPQRYNRKGVEFDLDDEYLARLREVLEMRRDLQAELARILAEDPRLLRRFMDSVRNRTNNLREELADLVAEQKELNREVLAWTSVDEANRPQMARLLMLRQAADATKVSKAAGELQSRYQAWLPLDREAKDAELAAASKRVQKVATAAGELSASAQRFITESQRAQAAAPSANSEGDAAESKVQATLEPILADGTRLYGQLNELEVSLRQLAAREEGAKTALFAANRLVDTRQLIADTSAFIRQMRAHDADNYPGAAEVDQYRLAMQTDRLAGKLGTIEQSLAGLLQRSDGSLPKPIAQKARELIATLDNEASPAELAAVYALHGNQLAKATQRQKTAGDALDRAEKLYDELMRLAIEELDKLPVQDPIADLLDDPTLDELLAQLEQESPIQELLGIPQRPSNLRIIRDWLRPGSGSGGSWIANQIRQDQRRTRQQLEDAYRRAVARALKEEQRRRKIKLPTTPLSDWNQLVSKLGDDLRQGRDKPPPEQYRRAIQQYFAQVSRAVAESEEQAP